MLSVKQRGIKYHFWVFGMTRPGIEPRFPGPLANTNYIYLKYTRLFCNKPFIELKLTAIFTHMNFAYKNLQFPRGIKRKNFKNIEQISQGK